MAGPNDTTPTQVPPTDSVAIDTATKSQDLYNIAKSKGIDLTKLGAAATDMFSLSVLNGSHAFDQFLSHTDSLQGFNNQLTNLKDIGGAASGALMTLAQAAGAPVGVLSGGGNIIKNFAMQLAQSADDAIRLQTNFLSMAGAGGVMGKVFSEAGEDLSGLNNMMLKQSMLISDISMSSGASATQVAKFWDELGRAIPNATSGIIEGVGKSGQGMNELDASMALATGTGRSVSDVIKNMTTAFEDFNATGDQSLEWTAKMSQLSETLGTKLSYTTDFLTNNAKAFQFMSTTASDAGNTLNGIFKALTDSSVGLSGKQATDFTGELINRMGKLTTAQKAFMSQQSGGPGGLQGAAQIDNQIRQGKQSEVLQKALENVQKSFGGKVYTQTEAGQSEFAAARNKEQVLKLQSGAFGDLIGKGPEGDAKANRLLEAMQKGFSLTEALGPALPKAIDRGQTIQGTTNTELSKNENLLAREQLIESNKHLELIQKYLGESTTYDRSAKGGERATALNMSRGTGASNAAETSRKINEGGTINRDQLRGDNAKQLASNAMSMLPEGMQKLLSGIMDKVTSNSSGVKAQGSNEFNNQFKALDDRNKEIIKELATRNLNKTQKAEFTTELGEVQQKKAQYLSFGNRFGLTPNESEPAPGLKIDGGTTTGRGPGAARAVNNNIAAQGRTEHSQVNQTAGSQNSGRVNPAQSQAPQTQHVIVTVDGIRCDSCKTLHPTNAHIATVTGMTQEHR